MVDVAGGIILAVILLFVGFIALLIVLGGFVKGCVALDKGFKGFGKWRAAGRTDGPAQPAKTYPDLSYTTNTGGYDAYFND
jgi:hypothetical protein